MMRLKWMKRFLSVVLCGAILTAGVYSGASVTSVPVSADDIGRIAERKASKCR